LKNESKRARENGKRSTGKRPFSQVPLAS